MDLEIRHDTAAHRFEATVNGETAYLDYEPVGEDALDFRSTWTPPAARDRGIGRAIVRHALAYAEREGKDVIPTCPFVRKVMEDDAA